MSADERAALVAAVKRRSPASDYLNDPVGFCTRFLKGFTQDPHQAEALRLLVEHKRVAVYGPHGLGKTAGISAPAVIWFAVTREAAGIDWKILTTASVGRQLTQFLWPGIRKMIRIVDFEALGVDPWVYKKDFVDSAIKGVYGHAFSASAENPDKIEGLHGEHIFILMDEAKAIPESIWDALEGAYANAGPDTGSEAWALATSTPGAKTSRLYDICARKPGFDDWYVRHVTVHEAIAAGRISADWVERRKLQWGETSALFVNKCLGEFTDSVDDSFVPYEWIEQAHLRWHKLDSEGWFEKYQGPFVDGLDPARHGQDSTVRCRTDHKMWAVHSFDEEPFTDNLAELGMTSARKTNRGRLVTDISGLGAGVHDAARRLQVADCYPFQGAEKPQGWTDATGLLTANNTRSAAYWNIRERLNPAHPNPIALPEDEPLIGELQAHYLAPKETDVNLIRVVSKDKIKEVLGRSPDRSDALTYAFWCHRQPARRRSRSVLEAVQKAIPGYGT